MGWKKDNLKAYLEASRVSTMELFLKKSSIVDVRLYSIYDFAKYLVRSIILCYRGINGEKYSRMDQVNFLEDSL